MKQTLAQTNPYLKTAELRNAAIRRSVASSSAIEGIHVSLPQEKAAQKTDSLKSCKAEEFAT